MDNLHNALIEKLTEESNNAIQYHEWWLEKCKKIEQYEIQRKQDNDNLIALAKLVDELKAENARLNEQNSPHNCGFSADMDMCEPVCDIPMKA